MARRANFGLRDVNTLLNSVLTLVGIYIALRAIRGTQTAIDTVTQPIAQKWFDITHGPGVEVLGRVQLPNGQSVLLRDIVSAGSSVDERGFFTWQGTMYQITGRTPAGDYTASRIIT